LSIPHRLSLKQRQIIIHGICSEDGNIDESCFDEARSHILSVLQKDYYPDFLLSAFYAKYQLESFSNGESIHIKGILNHDILLFHFMEFMESLGKNELSLVEFWMTSKNFSMNCPIEARSGDSMLIYEKFISLQASTPLGFSSMIRSKVEEAICAVDGNVKSDCFQEAQDYVEAVLNTQYLQSFLSSPIFSKYFSGLISSIEKSGVSSAASTPAGDLNERQRSLSGSSMNTTCSSETLSSTQNISTKNTLLASGSVSKGNKRKESRQKKNADFLEKTAEPDFLWGRKQSILTNIGHVDHLGRYVSCLELPPDVTQKRQVMMEPNMKTRISKAVRKIITNEDVEKVKEEMAWQMAELVITDVINRSKFPPDSDKADEEALNNLGNPATPTKIVQNLPATPRQPKLSA